MPEGRGMSTSTLDQIDLERLMDETPKCSAQQCDREATLRIRWICGCLDIVCHLCCERFKARILVAILRGLKFYCLACGKRDLEASHLSQVMQVTPL